MKRFSSEEVKYFISSPLFKQEVLLKRDKSYPAISIIMPSYNQAQFLERAILSVLNQNYPNLEYIIIDGGSTDGSIEIIKKYESYLAYWVSEEDDGQADGTNKGFKIATGEIIGWQNSDDIYLPGAFIKVARAFQKFPDVSIVFGNTYIIDDKDRKKDELRFTPFSVLTHFYEGMSINNQSSFWKRTLLNQIGLLDTRFDFSMDYEFFLRAALKNAKFKHIREFLGSFRIHPGSKTGRIESISLSDHILINKEYKRRKSFCILFGIISLLRRSLYYVIQGDIGYLLKGINRRLHLILK